jgi:phosphoglycerate dehydrogenase-like enzyme
MSTDELTPRRHYGVGMAPRTRVAVLDDYQKVAASCADWSRLGCQVTFLEEHLSEPSLLATVLADYEVIVAMRERTPFDRGLIGSLPRLRLLVTTGMRNASIDVTSATDLGITVCGTRSPGHATAELAFALIQGLARGLRAEMASVASGGWQVGLGRDLRGATLGVIGLGRLGSQVAGFGLAFGMDILAWSENLTDERAAEVGVARVAKERLLASSDFVTIHLRLSDRTRNLMGPAELDLMKPDACIVNTSRGEIIDEEALLAAIDSGSIAGAALDVFAREPLPSDHAVRNHPRILVTPHIGYVTRETYEVFYGDAVEDIEAWMAGSPVRVLS